MNSLEFIINDIGYELFLRSFPSLILREYSILGEDFITYYIGNIEDNKSAWKHDDEPPLIVQNYIDRCLKLMVFS